MNTGILFTLIASALSMGVSAVPGQNDQCTPINSMIVYGDSLSSAGFSGPTRETAFTYASTLSTMYGSQFSQAARGRATTCKDGCPLLFRLIAGMPVNEQIRTVPPTNSDLSIIWAGGNDLIYKLPATFADINDFATFGRTTAQRQLNNIREILSTTPSNHIVAALNMPEIQLAPFVSDEKKDLAESFVESFNHHFSSGIETLKTMFPEHSIVMVDVSIMLSTIEFEAQEFGLQSISFPCYSASYQCEDPYEHIFFDSVHPSFWVHQRLAEHVDSVLKASLPSPPCRH